VDTWLTTMVEPRTAFVDPIQGHPGDTLEVSKPLWSFKGEETRLVEFHPLL